LKQEPGFYKIRDHKTDKGTKLLKVAGTGDEQKAQLLAMADKYGVSHGEPVQGGSNWILFVKDAELKKIGKSEDHYEPTSPKQPKPFLSAPFPTMGVAKPGQEGSSSPQDIGAIESIEIGKFGHAVRMGAVGTFKGDQVYIRKVKDKSGIIHYEVRGELVHFNASKANLGGSEKKIKLHSAMTTPNPDSPSYHMHSFKGGMHDESGPNAGDITEEKFSPNGHSASTPGGGKINLFANTYESLNNIFTVRVPESADLETELAYALEKMGLDPVEAMRQQTDEDERIAIKWAIVKARLGPRAWMKDGNEVGISDRFNEVWLDMKLGQLGVTPEIVASARFETTFDNHQSVVFDDPAIKSSKVKFVYMGMNPIGLFHQIMDGSGWAARTDRYLNGIEQSGASASSDMLRGGSNGVFTRIGSSSHSSGSDWGLKCGNWKVVWHPRTLERADWRFYQSDSYGITTGLDSDMRSRDGISGSMETSNEVLFDAGLGLQDIAGVIAPSQYDKDSMIAKFKAAGVEQLNGIPMEDLIQVQTTNSRTQMAKKFVGLKKGVLP